MHRTTILNNHISTCYKTISTNFILYISVNKIQDKKDFGVAYPKLATSILSKFPTNFDFDNFINTKI